MEGKKTKFWTKESTLPPPPLHTPNTYISRVRSCWSNEPLLFYISLTGGSSFISVQEDLGAFTIRLSFHCKNVRVKFSLILFLFCNNFSLKNAYYMYLFEKLQSKTSSARTCSMNEWWSNYIYMTFWYVNKNLFIIAWICECLFYPCIIKV